MHQRTYLTKNLKFVSTKTLNSSWHKINYTRGVRKIVSFGKDISPIDKNFINYLKRLEVNGKICSSKIRNFKIGNSCKIISGIFKDKLCFINKMCSRDRVKVLLSFFGREINCIVSNSSLEPQLNA